MTAGVDDVTVIVVDDDPEICEAVSALLAGCGYGLRTYPSAERLLAEPWVAGAALVIVDVHLPGQSGVDLAAALHARYPDTALLVITGYPSARTARQAFRSGVVDYLSKPFEPEELLTAVQEALKAREDRLRQQWQLAQLRALVGELAPAAQGRPEAQAGQLSGAMAAEGAPGAAATVGPRPWAQITVDLDQRRVFRGALEIPLTRTEYAVLAHLYLHRPRVVDPRELAEAARGERLPLWEAREFCKTHIRNLRRKLRDGPGSSQTIVNVHGRGFRME